MGRVSHGPTFPSSDLAKEKGMTGAARPTPPPVVASGAILSALRGVTPRYFASQTAPPMPGGCPYLGDSALFTGSGADRARTDDLLHAMQALSQLSYGPVVFLIDHPASGRRRGPEDRR